MSSLPTFLNGQMPALGLGTFQVYNRDTIKYAIKNGVRHIDCAAVYCNELLIGEVIKECIDEGIVTREELFITTKLWNTCHNNVEEALRSSLEELQLNYVDLYLIHWPAAYEFIGLPIHKYINKATPKQIVVPTHKVWADMERMHDLGLTKNIGISNYHLAIVREILSYARIPPAVNQIELHPYNSRWEHVEQAKKWGVHVTAFSPLGSGNNKVLEDPVIIDIAKKHDCNPSNVVMSWMVANGVSAIPRSSNPERSVDNIKYVKLSEEDIKRVDGLNRNESIASYSTSILGCNLSCPSSNL